MDFKTWTVRLGDLWRRPRPALSVAVALACWLTIVGNVVLWRKLGSLQPGLAGLGAAAVFAAVVFAVQLGLLALTAWGRWMKPLWMAVAVAAGIAQHYMLRFGVVVDPSLVLNAFATNVGEARDVLGLSFVLDVAVVAVLPIAWLWQVPVRPIGRWRTARRALGAGVLSLGVGAGMAAAFYSGLAPLVRNHMELRYLPNPVIPLVSLGRAASKARRDASPAQAVTVTADARLGPSHAAPGARPPMLMLVVGETARADHFGLNGYRRDTTPELAAHGVTSFADVRSCGTYTLASVPCMFSPLGKARFRRDQAGSGNLLDVVQAAGMAVLWVDNQAGCKGVCDRVPNASTADLAGSAAAARFCQGDECLDEILLEGLDRRLAALPDERRRRGVLIVLHQMGSHGPAYSRRSSAATKRWTPECTLLALGDCAPGELVNAYDNSIAYTDHVLAASIDWLRARQDAYAPALLYVSDHGESLGEYGIFLHGLPDAIAPEAQTHVPMVAWLGDTIVRRDRVDAGCVAGQAMAPLSHDNLYHSVLGLLDIVSPTYRAGLDIWAPCRSTIVAAPRSAPRAGHSP